MNEANRERSEESSLDLDELGWLRLDPGDGETRRDALARALRTTITTGVMRPGVALPSTRLLSAQLGVSRGVAVDAYDQLVAQGYLAPRSTNPPVVAPTRPAAVGGRAAPTTPSVRYDLSPSTPGLDLFPARRWAGLLAEVARTLPAHELDSVEDPGELELREVLADYLGRTRGLRTDASRLVIVQGAAQGIDLLARVLAGRGVREVALEDPSLDNQPHRFRAHGLAVRGTPVDEDGMVVPAGGGAALVTPAHQFPVGVVMSGRRRRDLLEWAGEAGWLIEDDYDAEFRYDSRPVRALQGLAPERVIYIGTVSKVLAPGLRLGWIAAPRDLVDELARAKHLSDGGSPRIDQLALARFIARGHWEQHIRSARRTYARRRQGLLHELDRTLPGRPVHGAAAGVHVVLPLRPGTSDAATARAARRADVRVSPISQYAIEHDRPPALVVGYGGLRPSAVEGAVAALAQAVRGSE